jgi:hypothetical protein
VLVIRESQLEALAQAALRRFEDEMVAHLGRHAERLAALRGEAALRALVRTGIARARGHGFVQRGPIRLYLELMLAFGAAFDTDPQYAWAHAALAPAPGSDPMARAEALHGLALDYFACVAGPANGHALRALDRVCATLPQPGPMSAEQADAALREIYPEKYAFAGSEALQRLAQRALERAHAAALADGAGVLLALMYAFGHGVASDPMYPWIRNTLERALPAPQKLARLRSKALLYAAAVKRHFELPSGAEDEAEPATRGTA